jgi:hypothetical protein
LSAAPAAAFARVWYMRWSVSSRTVATSRSSTLTRGAAPAPGAATPWPVCVKFGLGVHRLRLRVVDQAQAELAVDLCLVGGIGLGHRGDGAARGVDEVADLPVAHRPWLALVRC